MPTRHRADELQILRLRTLAATRDITFGRVNTLRRDRLAVHARVAHQLSHRRANKLIAHWTRAPLRLKDCEKDPLYLGIYMLEEKNRHEGFLHLSLVEEIIMKDMKLRKI